MPGSLRDQRQNLWPYSATSRCFEGQEVALRPLQWWWLLVRALPEPLVLGHCGWWQLCSYHIHDSGTVLSA